MATSSDPTAGLTNRPASSGVSSATKQHDIEIDIRKSGRETCRVRAAWLPIWLTAGLFGRDFEGQMALTRKFVRPSGFEPETCGQFESSAGVRKWWFCSGAGVRTGSQAFGHRPWVAPHLSATPLPLRHGKH
jgi:hypothetical protein